MSKKKVNENNEVMKAIQDLKTEFSEVKILKRTQAEIKVELNNSITQLGNTKESVISRVDSSRSFNIRTGK